jgi:hypothetical protein
VAVSAMIPVKQVHPTSSSLTAPPTTVHFLLAHSPASLEHDDFVVVSAMIPVKQVQAPS